MWSISFSASHMLLILFLYVWLIFSLLVCQYVPHSLPHILATSWILPFSLSLDDPIQPWSLWWWHHKGIFSSSELWSYIWALSGSSHCFFFPTLDFPLERHPLVEKTFMSDGLWWKVLCLWSLKDKMLLWGQRHGFSHLQLCVAKVLLKWKGIGKSSDIDIRRGQKEYPLASFSKALYAFWTG